MTTPPETDVETLLEHQGFLRRLARSLVPEDRVEDVVQETWLLAFERPPRGSARGWLTRHESSYEDESAEVVDGRIDALAVGETAATLVLTKAVRSSSASR